MKRWLMLLVLVICSVPTWSQVSGTISFYTNRGDLIRNGSFKRWTREFSRIYPSAKVKVVLVERYMEEMASRFENRDYGDVVLVPTDMPKEAYSKFFISLDSMMLSSEVYFSNNWSYEDNDYAYSQGVSAEGLIYNKKVFRSVGIKKPPSTLTELYEICEKVKAAGKTAIALNVGAGWPLQQWDKAVMIVSGDGNYYQKMMEDVSPFDREKSYSKSLEIANTIFSKGYSEQDFVLDYWQQSKDDFASGEIAMLFLGSWAIPQVIESGARSKDVGFVPFPVDDTGKPRGVLNFDWGIAINRYSKKKTTARAWLRYLLTKSDFADISGFIPTVRSRQSGMPQLKEYMKAKPKMIQTSPFSNDFLRLANKSGMDFMGGNYVRNILLSPDFQGSMDYWNTRWSQARDNF